MPSTSGPPRRQHHHKNFPPQQYTALRGSDISLLAPIFAPKPRTPPASTTHDVSIKLKINELPSHLRSKISILSTFCSVHKGLNSLPITSILTTIQNETTPIALFHWAPVEQSSWLGKRTLAHLEEMNCIWQDSKTFQSNFGRTPNPMTRWSYISHKCSACKLTEVANNIPGIVALGGVIIARLDPANWKKSKRIQWFEKWIAVSVEREELTEGVVKAMWECGVKLRNAMGTGSLEKRAYIDEFVAQTRSSMPVRPGREGSQESHVRDAERLMSEKNDAEGEDSDAESIKTMRKRFPPVTPPPQQQQQQQQQAEASSLEQRPASKIPNRYVDSMDFFGRVQQSFRKNDSKTLLNPADRTPLAPRRPESSVYSQPGGGYRPASSIYSRATDDDKDERWESRTDWFNTSVLEEEEFIDSYGRSSKGSGEVKRDTRGFI